MNSLNAPNSINNINALLCDFENLSVTVSESLCHDVSIIIESWGMRRESLDCSRLLVFPGEFESTLVLYEQVIQLLVRSNCCLIELMPYVDDYLEWYAGRCAPF